MSEQKWEDRGRLLYGLFNALLVCVLPLVALFIFLRWRRRVAKGLTHSAERWGHLSAGQAAQFQTGRWWWVHAVSVGEAKAIHAFLRQAPRAAGVRIVLSLVTPEALEWATRHRVADEIIAAPIDLPRIVRRVFRVIHPEFFISVESEFWPNLLREAKLSGAQVALINGRISERSFRSYRRAQFLLNPLWGTLDLLAVRQSQDAERFAALGIPEDKIHVTGNLKYDMSAALAASNGHTTPAFPKPLIIIGCSREGEESQLLPALEAVRQTLPGVRVVVAPRHLERLDEVEQLFKSQGLPIERKSAWSAGSSTPYILWDSMGDLLDAYRQADIAVIGGSFVPKGGQNPLEAAVFNVPVLFGPSMDNFHGIADHLVRQGGARQVALADLAPQLTDLLRNTETRQAMGKKARRAVELEQGATLRTLELLKRLAHA